MKKISIIIPCYNEEYALPMLFEELETQLIKFNKATIELVFVNDGSTDGTLDIIKAYSFKPFEKKYISFSRNFGKEAAMYAGLEASTGDYITFMDADLQDPPSLLPKMYDTLVKEKLDIVGTRRKNRSGEPKIRSLFSKAFYKIASKLSQIEVIDGQRDYVLITRQVANSILDMKEFNRYSKGLINYVGFDIKWIEYDNVIRSAGNTKWSFWKLFRYGIEGITAFSTTPLIISSFIGLLFCLISFLLIVIIIIKTLIFGDPTSGWPSLVCIIFMVSGIQLFSLGIIGQYLAKTYSEVKRRPLYIIKEKSKD